MNSRLWISCLLMLVSTLLSGQHTPLEKLSFLEGVWSGTGSGFGNERSKINSSFQFVLNDNYIKIRNESRFEPTENNHEGELHIDEGFISYDQVRKLIVFRQFNIEGYINTYVLVDSLSNEDKLVFLTEAIENFVEGGSARWTINRINEDQIETIFDVSFPEQGYTCFGTNKLLKVKDL